MRDIILASQSPWRKKILEKTGLPFRVVVSHFEEDLGLKMPPKKLAIKMARGKAEAVARRHKNAIVIGADTFVVLGKRIIGKPKSQSDARKILAELSGKWHTLITGYAIMDSKSGKRIVRAVETRAHMLKLSGREIASYIKSGEGMYCAGAYAIQSRAGIFIDRIEGDYWNIVGLPLCALVAELKKFGIKV